MKWLINLFKKKPVRRAVQVIVSSVVAIGLAQLTRLVGSLSPVEIAYVYVPLTGIYYSGVLELEKKYPSWAWILILLPSDLPDTE